MFHHSKARSRCERELREPASRDAVQISGGPSEKSVRALTVLWLGGLLAWMTGASVCAAAQRPAAWIPHEVMVSYHKLPAAYSCTALWYKVGDILRAVGAWKYVSITPYDCKPGTATNGRSPQLEIHLLTVRSLDAKDARWAQTEAVERSVTLRPGHPKSLARADCELLRQTEQGVLPLLSGVHVEHADLSCRAGADHFGLTVKTLIPTKTTALAAR